MASVWGKSFGLSWGNSWGIVEGVSLGNGGVAGSPETGRSSCKPRGTWNGIPLIDIEAAKNAPQIIIVPKSDATPESHQRIAEIQAQLQAYRAAQLQRVQSAREQAPEVKAAVIVSNATADAYKAMKVRQSRDNKDIAEFCMAFSVIVLGKGRYGAVDKVAKHRTAET